MGSKILKSVVLTSIKNILLAVIAINYYVLMINLVSLLRDAAYNFVNSVIKESKYYSYVMEEDFSKELVVANKN